MSFGFDDLLVTSATHHVREHLLHWVSLLDGGVEVVGSNAINVLNEGAVAR